VRRDHLMVLMAFRHGLRVSEMCDLQWSDIEFRRGTLHVRRLKGSKDSTHYLEADESRPLKALHKASESPYVFTSERGGPMSAAGFRKQLARWGEKAKLGFPIHPHMLRHACGYALANRGMDTRSLQVNPTYGSGLFDPIYEMTFSSIRLGRRAPSPLRYRHLSSGSCMAYARSLVDKRGR
jgi:integrase